jgi:DNA primase catalytic core
MSRDIIDSIKDKLDIVDVIGKKITLTREGSNGKYTGTVGTKGKTGKSLHVDKSMQTYYDFKNGSGGDVLNWLAYENNLDINSDFTEVLKIAANIAGVELTDTTKPEDLEYRQVTDLYTTVAEIYHNALDDELYFYIHAKWGITKETVKKLKIGFAPAIEDRSSYLLKRLDKERLIKSGLVLNFGNDKIIDFFNGRLVFPYWKNGKVVYFIARAVDGKTPRTKYECYTDTDGNIKDYIKYKKLLTPEKHEYVSKFAGNNYFYGEDSIKRADSCIITEGVTDCIMAMQNEIPCISPVTVQFRDRDHDKLYGLVADMKKVFICNDNEKNEAGQKGALKTAQFLQGKGIDVRLVNLPLPEGQDKIDLAEYLKDNDAEDFYKLVNKKSITVYEYLLAHTEVSESPTDKIKEAIYFCENELSEMPESIRNAFIRYNVKQHFGLTSNDIKDIQKSIKIVSNDETEEHDEEDKKEDLQPDEDHLDVQEAAKAKNDALNILKTGNPMHYICDTIKNIHIGDERATEGLNLAIANQSCLNTQGIQIKLSGDSGGGKSHLAKSVCHCLRDKHIIESSLSAKAAYYMDLQPGTILFSDDTEISEDMETVIKRSTTNYQDYTTHTTVKDGNSMTLTIPPRILWLITSVEDEVSDQLLNRQLIFNVDTSTEQKNKIFEMQKAEALEGEIKTLQVTHEVVVCREMWDMIKSETFKVRVPFIDDVDVMDKSNSRNFPMFLDMLKGYTIFNHMQRDKDEDGYLLATKDDFYAAKSLFESQTESVLTKLNEKERRIIQAIGQSGKEGAEINQIAKSIGLSYHVVRNALKGRNRKQGGLLEKVKNLKLVEGSKSFTVEEEQGMKTTNTKKREIYILEDFNGWDIFDTGFVYLKSETEE